jgi:PAS domain S-box-containing protein
MEPELLFSRFLSGSQQYAFICLDPQGIVTAWRGAAAALFGYSEAEMLGRSSAELFVPEDRERGFVEYELELARKVGHSEDDRWHVRKDGVRIWVMGITHAVRDDNGEVLGFVKTSRDRTDMRAWSEKLQNEDQRLNEAHERTLAFLRTLGHELRNPLSPLTNAALIIERLHDDERTRRAVEIVKNQARILTRLAEELMHVAQLEARKVTLQRVTVDVRGAVQGAVNAMDGAAQQAGLALEAVMPAGPLYAALDPERFQQVLVNLISNSIKYTPQGGSIWAKVTQEGTEIVFRIEDTGIGIQPDMLPRIFDLFSRQPEAEGLDPKGLGIGLAVVREIVQLHGGSVQARSGGHGLGSEFTVRLPAAEAPKPA